MAFCRSRKIGNCSDYSQNKLLQENAYGTFPESFPIPGSLGGGGSTYGSDVALERQTVFLDCVYRFAGLGWAKNGKAVSSIAGHRAKAGVRSLSVRSDELYSVSLIGFVFF